MVFVKSDRTLGGNAENHFFLAMAHWHLGEKGESHRWYSKGVEWVRSRRSVDRRVRRLFTEATEMLGMKDTPFEEKSDDTLDE